MPVEAVISPHGDFANTHSYHRLTPGSQPWKAAVIRDLRNGYGVEDVALRLDCDIKHVRAVVAKLRRLGLLVTIYEQARKEWKREALG